MYVGIHFKLKYKVKKVIEKFYSERCTVMMVAVPITQHRMCQFCPPDSHRSYYQFKDENGMKKNYRL